jgi:uncharacterized membrane protein
MSEITSSILTRIGILVQIGVTTMTKKVILEITVIVPNEEPPISDETIALVLANELPDDFSAFSILSLEKIEVDDNDVTYFI